MTIHQTIKAARLAKGWSMEELAEKVSIAEGLAKPLAWQTVQQWEKEGGTAPSRKRIGTVLRVLDIAPATVPGGELAAQALGLNQSLRSQSQGVPELTLAQALEVFLDAVEAVARQGPTAKAELLRAFSLLIEDNSPAHRIRFGELLGLAGRAASVTSNRYK